MAKFMSITALACALLIGACDTVHGTGRDVGHTVAKAPDRSM